VILNFGQGLPNAIPVTGDWDNSGVTKIGVFSNGTWYLDMNGNGVWDGPNVDKLIPNFGQGLPNAIPVTGDWNGTGVTKIGVFSNGTWYLDVNGNGVWDGSSTDKVILNFGQGLPNAIPVTGDWTNTGVTRVGVFLQRHLVSRHFRQRYLGWWSHGYNYSRFRQGRQRRTTDSLEEEVMLHLRGLLFNGQP